MRDDVVVHVSEICESTLLKTTHAVWPPWMPLQREQSRGDRVLCKCLQRGQYGEVCVCVDFV